MRYSPCVFLQTLSTLNYHAEAGLSRLWLQEWVIKKGSLLVLLSHNSLNLGALSFVQSLDCVQLFITPWTAAHQVSLSPAISQSLPKFMAVASVMPSNHFILCCPLLLLPSIFCIIRVFSSESALRIRWPKYRASASATVLPMNFQGWFPLGLTSLISLKSRGFSKVFSNTKNWKRQLFIIQPPLWTNSHICTWLLEKPN